MSEAIPLPPEVAEIRGFIKYLAAQIARMNEPCDAADIEQVGLVAACKSAELYNPDGGATFLTYARNHIRYRMLRSVFQSRDVIRRPLGAYDEAPIYTVSLSRPISAEIESPLGDIIADDNARDPVREADFPILRDALARLSPRDRNVLIWRHFQDLTNQEIGNRLGLSEEGGRLACKHALEQLRRLFGCKPQRPHRRPAKTKEVKAAA